MKNICITGAQGSIGSMIHAGLADQFNVTALRGRADLDLMDAEAVNNYFAEHRFDVVIHCAIAGAADIGDPNFDIFRTNWIMYENLASQHRRFNRLINIGSGCEIGYGDPKFEFELWTGYPDQPYGMSKNMIARDVLRHDNWINLRLYGTVGKNRIFDKIHAAIDAGETVFTMFNDKYMDYIEPADFLKIVRYYCETEAPEYRDINMVYDVKKKVSEVLQEYIINNNLPLELKVNPDPVTSDSSQNLIRYSSLGFAGDGSRLKSMGIL